MTVTEIIDFGAEPSTVDDTIQQVVKAVGGVKAPQHSVVGTQVQDKGAIQITSEWDGVEDYANFAATPDFTAYMRSVRSVCGEPRSLYHVALNRSAFGADGPATANVVEFVANYFPASRVTPEFQKQIDEDFLKFDEILMKGVEGGASWSTGWVLEELKHEDIQGEKAKCFLVIRGWERLDQFEQAIKTDAHKEAIPLLFAWKAPYKLWHVERKS